MAFFFWEKIILDVGVIQRKFGAVFDAKYFGLTCIAHVRTKLAI